MADQNGQETTRPDHVSPGDREARDNRAKEQDLDKPAEGRDVPPADPHQPARPSDSPWLGGG